MSLEEKPAQLAFSDAPKQPPQSQTYSVSQVVRLAAQQLESHFGDIWVEGEVSNLKAPTSGHVYFTLKDNTAQIPVVIFRSSVQRLKFRIEDGQQLRCHGKLSIYDVQGRFQLNANMAEPTGLGALQLAFEQLKKKLQQDGLFEAALKKPLPFLPRKIAVVTSATGAAIRDIIQVLDNRCPVHVIVCPTAVQGQEAALEVAAAIRQADALCADLMIVGRGGGSIEDLWAFNTEVVARTIFAANTPIISAVGHEIDVTISDFVADLRAPTPSIAAKLAVPEMSELKKQLSVTHARLGQSAKHRLQESHLVLERKRNRLGSPLHLVNRSRMHLDDTRTRLETAVSRSLAKKRGLFNQTNVRLLSQQPSMRLAKHKAMLRELTVALSGTMKRKLEASRSTLAKYLARLEALSPLGVLARGYSLASDEKGHVISDAQNVVPGDKLELALHRGKLNCTVNSTTLHKIYK
ncbi:MAG: exodeoxyribonuclease VII large subunit [Pseudomonadota bacterium]